MSKTSGVNTQVLNTNVVATDRASQTKNVAKQAPVADVAKTAKASITSAFSGIGSKLAASAAGTDDVRTDKVAALKSAIDSGTYHVPASAVADKIISSLLG